jgi:hypothetical protein
MFQFAGFASPTYVFSGRYRRSGGLPHSEIHGSRPARGSPWLIATCCVLHRLSVPRHPPDALHTLVPYLRMRHAQEKAHRGQTPARPHPAKMHRHDPTSSLPLRGDGPVGSSSVTHSLHMSKIPYPPSGRYLLSLSRISRRLALAKRLGRVIEGHCPSSFLLVEADGIEPTTSCLQSTRSPN